MQPCSERRPSDSTDRGENVFLRIFDHIVRDKYPAVHGNVNPVGKCLYRPYGTGNIEGGVACAETRRCHGACQYHNLVGQCTQMLGRFHHGIRTMGQDNSAVWLSMNGLVDGVAILVGEVEAVFLHDDVTGKGKGNIAIPKNLLKN